MYEARRVAEPVAVCDAPADAAVAAALRSGPRRASVSPFAALTRVAPATLTVALAATLGVIVVGSRTAAEAQPATGADPVALAARADQLSRTAVRAVPTIEPTAEPTASAPVAAAWSAQFGTVVAAWYAQSDVTVRSGSSADARALGTVKSGEKVDITDQVVGGFRQVVYSKQVGWVPAGQVAEKAPVLKTPGKTSSTRVLGLTAQAMGVYNTVMGQWGGQINSVGGYRASSLSDHQFGRAIDFMLTPGAESALGWTIAKYLAAHASELGVDHIIFEQKIWTPGNPTWRPMADRGGITANHYDHVHVSVER